MATQVDELLARWQGMTPDQRAAILAHPGFKIKPLVRGKQLDSFHLSTQGMATGHFWEGAVRSSKTIVSILRWIEFALKGPPGELAMIGKTERTLKRNVVDTITALLGTKAVRYRQGAGELTLCGRRIYVAGANDEAAVARIQGLTLVGFYGDEMPTWPKTVFDMARTRCSDPHAEWFGTGNPASSNHHLNTDWIARAKLHLRRDGSIIRRNDPAAQDVHVYSFTIYDNPFLTAKFVKSLEQSYTGMFFKRFILGEWCMAEGAIYDAWDPERHVVKELPAIERWISVGLDHGTTSPLSAVSFGLSGKRLYATAEHRYDSRKTLRRKTDLEYAEDLRLWLPKRTEMPDGEPELFAVDPSAGSLRQQLFRFSIVTKAADNSVSDGIATVASLIARDCLHVHESCAGLIAELPDYAWDPKASALGEDKPIKLNDHSCDAARYGLHTGRHAWWYDLFPEELATV